MRMRNPKDKDEVINNCSFLIKNSIDFKNDNVIEMEVGMGKGNFLLNKALNNPNINYIGVEKYSSVASVAIKKIRDYNLDNLKIIIGDIKLQEELLKNKIAVIYLNFSDPWPKARHEKRRLTSPSFLDLYDKLFKAQKVIIMKTDNDDLFSYSLKTLQEHGYQIKEISYDLHKENIPNILTEYEEKFGNLGSKIKYLKAIK